MLDGVDQGHLRYDRFDVFISQKGLDDFERYDLRMVVGVVLLLMGVDLLT